MSRHDCETALAMDGNRPSLRPCCAAVFLGVHASTVGRLVDREHLPADIITKGPSGHRTLRFRRNEIEQWLAGRRERQVRANLEGVRYTRRSA